jgi:ribosomal protein L22
MSDPTKDPKDEAAASADQQERADAEAARAAAAAEEAAAAAESAETPTTTAAAAEAEELAEEAEAAAEDAAKKPKRERARKAREAEQAADQAEEAADEAVASAKRSLARKKTDDEPSAEEAPAEEKPKRPRAKKKTDDEPPAEEAKPSKETRPTRRRDERRPVEVGLTVSAQAKYVRTSARKARLVCDHIRGKDVVEARALLAFTPRAAAKAWIKLLESAVANAEHNHELVGEDLRILSVHADEGPTLKRFRPRAMGRATRIRKRTSHLTITLTPKES